VTVSNIGCHLEKLDHVDFFWREHDRYALTVDRNSAHISKYFVRPDKRNRKSQNA